MRERAARRRSAASLEKAYEKVKSNLQTLVGLGEINEEQAEAALGNIYIPASELQFSRWNIHDLPVILAFCLDFNGDNFDICPKENKKEIRLTRNENYIRIKKQKYFC